MIQLLTGANSYEHRSLRTQRVASFMMGKGDEAVSVVDGMTLSVDELPQLLMGASLFAPERLIIIDGADAQKAVWEKLADYLPQTSDSTDVLLIAPGADKRTKTYKWLQKNADVTVADELNEVQLTSWVQNKAREHSMDLRPETARYLLEFTAGNQWQLENDMEKLHLSGRPVTAELIRELLIPNPQASAFELLDAALAGKTKEVDRLIEGVRTGEDPYRFFGLLSNQIFAIFSIAAAGNRPADTIAKDLSLHPFVVRKTQPLARRLNSGMRTRLVEIAATTDIQLKSSGIDPWVLLTTALKAIVAAK